MRVDNFHSNPQTAIQNPQSNRGVLMVSLGIGLTNNCNLNCAHCYRDQDKIHNLNLQDIKNICENLAINSIGFGTGENGLNPEYFDIIEKHWNRIDRFSGGLPRTFVHGDFSAKNIRIQNSPDGISLYPFDWEFAGWGNSCVDLGSIEMDLEAYWTVVRSHWPNLNLELIEQISKVGKIRLPFMILAWSWVKTIKIICKNNRMD